MPTKPNFFSLDRNKACTYGYRFKEVLACVLVNHYDDLCSSMDSMEAGNFGQKMYSEQAILGRCDKNGPGYQSSGGYWLRKKFKLANGREANNLFVAVCLLLVDLNLLSG